jgi:hypothetical protein
MEHRQEFACLAVDLRIPCLVASEHEIARKVESEQELGVDVVALEVWGAPP